MGHVARFQFLRIFQCHLLEKCLEKAVGAFKDWASRGITAGRKFLKCILEPKASLKHLNIVSEGKYGTCRPFSVFKDFSMSPFEKVLQKGFRAVYSFGF